MTKTKVTPEQRLRDLWIAAVLFIGAMVSALHLRPDYRIIGGGERIAVIKSLLSTGTFANPFAANQNTGPTAILPPFYFYFVSLALRVFKGREWLVYLTVVLHGMHASLFPSVSRLFFGRIAPGVWAAISCIVLPVFVLLPVSDSMCSAAELMLFCLLTSWLLEHGASVGWSAVLSGLAAAVLLLTNPAVLLVVVGWISFLLLKQREPWKRGLAFGAVFLLAVTAGCMPWLARNYRVFHRVVPVRDNLGLELYISNNDCAEPTLEANLGNGCHELTHPIFSRNEVRMLIEMGEVDYNRARMQAALQWIQSHPRRFLMLTCDRIIAFWLPPHSAPVWMITGLSVVGLAVLIARRTPIVVFLVFALAAYPLLYYFVQSTVSYRYPVMWISLLCGGYALCGVSDFVARRWRHLSIRHG